MPLHKGTDRAHIVPQLPGKISQEISCRQCRSGALGWIMVLGIDTLLCLAPQQCFSSLVCVCCVFFPGSVSVWIFAWLCEWDNALTAGCAVTLSSGVLVY